MEPTRLAGKIFCVVLMSLIPTHASHALDQCGDVLQKTDISRIDEVAQRSAFLQLIDSDASLQEAKNITGGLTAIVDDIPVDAQANYSAFSQWRSRYLQTTHTYYDEQERHSMVTSFLKDSEVDAWAQCIGKQYGVFLGVSELRPTTVTITFEYIPPHVDNPINETLTNPVWSGGLPIDSLPFPTNTMVIWSQSFQFSHDETKDFSLRWNVGASYNSHLLIPAKTPDPTYQTHCVINVDFAGLSISNTASYVCGDLKPNARITTHLNMGLSLDGGHGYSVKFNAGLVGGDIQSKGYDWLSGDIGQAHQFAFSSDGTVDASGVATYDITIVDAPTNIGAGVRTTATATPGSTVTITAVQ